MPIVLATFASLYSEYLHRCARDDLVFLDHGCLTLFLGLPRVYGTMWGNSAVRFQFRICSRLSTILESVLPIIVLI